MEVVGQICGGSQEEIVVRQKSGKDIELGDLLIAEKENGCTLMQVYGLEYGSQIRDKSRELIAGMNLEGFGGSLEFMEPGIRNYIIARCKPVASISGRSVRTPKSLPDFMTTVRRIEEKDLGFLTRPPNPLFLGKVRSGSRVLDFDVFLDGSKAIPHHILIPASTGKGKSNLVKVLLWGALDSNYCGFLVLDPHDEYFGRVEPGLKDHPKAEDKVKYYSCKSFPGAATLVINLRDVRPWHFDGIMRLTDAQRQAMSVAYNTFKNDWICAILRGESMEKKGVQPITQEVLKRILDSKLGLNIEKDGKVACRSGIFSQTAGGATVNGIVKELEEGKTVIIDTSSFSDETELLVGSIIAQEVMSLYRKYKTSGESGRKPAICVVLEEAPRVLGSDALAEGSNIYSVIAREGRKFNVGLMAITQLSSIIPRQILANMNTKIILGNEMEQERNAVISSASQDLSKDSQNIASLDKGEALVTSSFIRFAVPIRIPLFGELVSKERNSEKVNVIG